MYGLRHDLAFTQGVYLIFHERYERGHHHGYAVHGEGRHLKGNGFAAARGHESEGVASRYYALYDVGLYGAERVVAPIFFQYVEVFGHAMTSVTLRVIVSGSMPCIHG